ncbi:MAG: DUF389 domain-containing protein [Bacteroidota bacterium]
MRSSIIVIWEELKNILWSIINLRDTTDVKGTIVSIRNSITIRGYNVWILACGAMLASIGLNLNSPAVIIGAMLISPLMSPILGIGLSIGINDREHLMLAIENFGIAVASSLIVSCGYFALSPFNLPTPEILSRTEPTILDVFIAIFGGIAGIVATSRKDKTNAIPGVAIATALMPPICVGGFGLANGQWEIFAGAMYLFFINAVFIALSTYVIVRFLRFPYVEYVDEHTRRKAVRWIAVVVFLIIVPSGYFFYNVLQRVRLNSNIEAFIASEIDNEVHKVNKYDRVDQDSTHVLMFYLSGRAVSPDTIKILDSSKFNYDLDKYKLKFFQVSFDEEKLISQSAIEAQQAMEPRYQALEARMDQLETLQAQVKDEEALYTETLKEAKAAFPILKSLSLSPQTLISDFEAPTDTQMTVVAQWQPGLTRSRKRLENQRLQNWLTTKLKRDTVLVLSP